jgi:2,3,4,5-tetrahydropyridine-2-carboxylate N-succinyltransferase
MSLSARDFEQIRQAYLQRATLTAEEKTAVQPLLRQLLEELSQGSIRVATPPTITAGDWQVNEAIKQGILLYFALHASYPQPHGSSLCYDKLALQFRDNHAAEHLKTQNIRLVPGAVVREGAYLGHNTVVMPSFINVGAYVGSNCLIDTWATVGSCAQIGNRVHLSGGAGIGGVLEPVQARPTIIEDDCFIGARSEIVEGVIVEQGSVIAMGVFLGQSTKIYNLATKEISYGRIPAGSVVVPGSLPYHDTGCQLAAAIIIKTVDAKTRAKVEINELLRSFPIK